MKPTVRKFALTAHVTASVGWLGAVGAFLALAVAGLASQDVQVVRAAYLAMELITWFVIVPFAFASLGTGLVVSLGTTWGLFRYYWVLAKLLITIIATILLLVHTQPIGILAASARDVALSSVDLGRLQLQLVGDAGFALLALLINVTLSVFKPWGMTPYGVRKQQDRRMVSRVALPSRLETDVDVESRPTAAIPGWAYVIGIHVIGLVLLFLVVHLTGSGMGNH